MAETVLTQRKQLAALALTRGDVGTAEAEITAVLEESPNDLEALDQRTQVYCFRGDLERATATCEKLRALVPRNDLRRVKASIDLGQIFFRWRRLGDARRELTQAIKEAEGMCGTAREPSNEQQHLGLALHRLANVEGTAGDLAAAAKLGAAALECLSSLLQTSANRPKDFAS